MSNMAKVSKSENQLLEPVIITYNRAPLLKKTLQAFFDSGLKNMRVHVLNNASTDDTEEVVKQFQTSWPNLIYHENFYNIGGNANILRAVELSHSIYHWVIGDDDEWCLTNNLNELLNVLQQQTADIIRLGWLASPESRGVSIAAATLTQNEALFYASVSMISSTIIKRSIISKYLPIAYQNIADSYPQLVPIIRAIEEMPVTVYTTSSDLLIHTPSKEPGYFYGDLEWYAGWYRTSRFFQKENAKSKFINEVTLYMNRDKKFIAIAQFTSLLKILLYYKSFGLKQTQYLQTMFTYGIGKGIVIFTLLIINTVMPRSFLKLLRIVYFKLFRLKPKNLNVNRARL